MDHKRFRNWIKQEHMLRAMPKSKCALCLGLTQWPVLENHVKKWIIRRCNEHNYMLGQIWNMNDTPVWFDIPSTETVENHMAKAIFVKTSSHAVVLGCMADGTILKPLVTFKRKTLLSVKFPSDVFVHCHVKGWIEWV